MTAPHGGPPAAWTPAVWTPGPADWVVDPHATPAPRRRRRTGLLVGAALLVVAAIAGGIVLHGELGSGPDSPHEAAEQFFAADQRHDWSASWNLLCAAEQQAVGSLERYVVLKERIIATSGSDFADVTVTVGRSRLRPDSSPPAHLVEYYLAEHGGMHARRILVVEEDGRFAVCNDS